jgi:hypothetical protein
MGAWPLQRCGKVDSVNRCGIEQRAKQGAQDENEQDQQAAKRQPMPQKPATNYHPKPFRTTRATRGWAIPRHHGLIFGNVLDHRYIYA